MPTLTCDWREQARILISTGMSIPAAARELDVPLERVKKWATRCKLKQSIREAKLTVSAVSLNVPSAADILAKQGPETRAKLSIAGNKAATALADLPGEALIGKNTSTALLQVTKANAVIHSWQEQAPGQQVMVNVNLLGVELPQAVPVAPILDLPG